MDLFDRTSFHLLPLRSFILQRSQDKIRREAASRGITRLYHFTPTANGRSILCNGLMSRNTLVAQGSSFHVTDELRIDDNLDGISVSIHSINESMFRAKQRDFSDDWLIFELKASILWTHTCRYCWRNASSSENRKHKGFRGGHWAFEKMFEDRPVSSVDNRSYRGVCEIPNFKPTDNSAEVQIFDPIASDIIVDVTVRTQRIEDELDMLMREIDHVKPIVVNDGVFR